MNIKSQDLVEISPASVGLNALRDVFYNASIVLLNDNDKAAINRSQQIILDIVKDGRTVYGVNTGFGLLATTSIPDDQLSQLQTNLLLSHSAGVGDYLSDDVVRLSMTLKILSLSQGNSGIRLQVIEALNTLLSKEIYPCIPEKGSVGASGDLAPLSAMAAVLIGEGFARIKGEVVPAVEALKQAGLEVLTLGPKEGLALINGTQISNALALSALFKIENIFNSAVVAGSLSVDAAMGTDTPFDQRIHDVRGQKGQMAVAKYYREMLDGSEIKESHADCGRVQDPYCLRCQPQVMGAVLDFMSYSATTLELESRAVSDNPLVFPENGDVLSGGNFHAEPVAFAADNLAIILCEIGNMSERRTSLLMDSNLSGLPPFLVKEPGLNSGFMIAQVTAAALASENKQLSHPGSVDTIPTSANQEDHVSMATHSARRLHLMADNAAAIVAVELLAAAQGVDFRSPMKTSPLLQKVVEMIRKKVSFYDKDRLMTPDIEAMKTMVLKGEFNSFVEGLVPSGR